MGDDIDDFINECFTNSSNESEQWITQTKRSNRTRSILETSVLSNHKSDAKKSGTKRKLECLSGLAEESICKKPRNYQQLRYFFDGPLLEAMKYFAFNCNEHIRLARKEKRLRDRDLYYNIFKPLQEKSKEKIEEIEFLNDGFHKLNHPSIINLKSMKLENVQKTIEKYCSVYNTLAVKSGIPQNLLLFYTQIEEGFKFNEKTSTTYWMINTCGFYTLLIVYDWMGKLDTSFESFSKLRAKDFKHFIDEMTFDSKDNNTKSKIKILIKERNARAHPTGKEQHTAPSIIEIMLLNILHAAANEFNVENNERDECIAFIVSLKNKIHEAHKNTFDIQAKPSTSSTHPKRMFASVY